MCVQMIVVVYPWEKAMFWEADDLNFFPGHLYRSNVRVSVVWLAEKASGVAMWRMFVPKVVLVHCCYCCWHPRKTFLP